MRTIKITVLLTALLSMVGAKSFAYDIAVANADGVTIYYNYINDGTELEVTRSSSYPRVLTNVVIPESVTYGSSTYNVTSIGNTAFSDCYQLTSLSIPNSVTTIGYSAFSGCQNLTSVTIGSGVTYIGEGAFISCRNLTSVYISDLEAWCNIEFAQFSSHPFSFSMNGSDKHLFLNGEEVKDLVIPESVATIGDWAFYNCTGMTSVTISNGMTTIGGSVFRNCTGLTSLTISNSVTTIGYYAFSGCSSLTSLDIPNSVTSIIEWAFSGCYGLTSLVIPNNVKTIGSGAFATCRGITSVTIGSGVTEIGEGAFELYSSQPELVVITSLIEDPMDIGQWTFGGLYNDASLYVPQGTLEKYKAREGWKEFVNMIEGTPSGIETPLMDNKGGTIKEAYDLGGKQLSQPQRGLNIVKMSDGTTKKMVVTK